MGLKKCPYKDKPCINRNDKKECEALLDVKFQGECHFRKEKDGAPFVVDMKGKR